MHLSGLIAVLTPNHWAKIRLAAEREILYKRAKTLEEAAIKEDAIEANARTEND
jgi:hypothetical protein